MGLPISIDYMYSLFEIPPPGANAELLRPKVELTGAPGEPGKFLFQDKDGHLYERSFEDEAKLVEFVRGLRRAA